MTNSMDWVNTTGETVMCTLACSNVQSNMEVACTSGPQEDVIKANGERIVCADTASIVETME